MLPFYFTFIRLCQRQISKKGQATVTVNGCMNLHPVISCSN